jgi:hypothetical protein
MANRTGKGAHTETVFELIRFEDRPIPVDVDLDFDAADPLAVRISLALHAGEPVAWVVGRDLLTAGLQAPSGAGDVRLQPVADNVALLELTSVDGQSRFYVPISDLAEFLDESYVIVARHRESDRLAPDLDHALRTLLDTAEADPKQLRHGDS